MVAGIFGSMRLSEEQIRVLGTIELDAELSAVEVARRTRLKTHTVQRIVRGLIDEGVIAGQTALIDVAKLGLVEYGINFPYGPASEERRSACLEFMLESREVSWMAEVGGDIDLMFNLLARSPQRVVEFLSELSARFPHVLERKKTCQRTERMRFPRGIWIRRAAGSPRYAMSRTLGGEALDPFDREILVALSQSAIESQRDLARGLGIPIATFLRRVARLRERGILLGFAYRINLEKIGISQFRVHVVLADLSDAAHKRMIAFCGRQPGVKVLIRCIGEWDYELEADARTSAEIKGLIDQMRREFKGDLISCRSIPIFRHLKFISFPAI